LIGFATVIFASSTKIGDFQLSVYRFLIVCAGLSIIVAIRLVWFVNDFGNQMK
jgi:hypothetical protein